MANASSANVISIDTDAVVQATRICGIRYIPGTGSPSVVIKADSSNGVTIYQNSGTTEQYEQIKIKSPSGVHVNVAGTGTIVYLYLD